MGRNAIADDQLPPNSPQSEQGVIGCLLMDSRAAYPECVNRIPSALVFFDIKHRALYEVIAEMADANELVDTITLSTRLSKTGKLRDVGGLEYVSELANAAPSAHNVGYYLEPVIDAYKRRLAMQRAAELRIGAMDQTKPIDDTIAESDRKLFDGPSMESETANKTILSEAVAEWEYAHQNPGQITGISSGLKGIDALTWGWQNEHLIIVGARPSVGKTSMLVGFADTAAVELGIPALVFSLESSKKEWLKRTVCRRARLDSSEMRKGKFWDDTFQKLGVAMAKVNKAPLYVVDRMLNISQIRSTARHYHRKHGIKLILLDYLQKTKPSRNRDTRTYEIAQVSEGLKEIAKELNLPVIAAAQLSRDSDKEKTRTPRLSDFRDSGSIEQDADVAFLLYREKNQHGLICAKNRDGETDIIPITYIPKYTRFEDGAPDTADPHPSEPNERDYDQ